MVTHTNLIIFDRVWNHLELWRLVSNFFFFDYFSLNWLFHMLFLLPNAASLEKNHFRGKMSHFVWMIFILGLLQTGASLFLYHYNLFRVMFLGPAFSFGKSLLGLV
jgi:Derlin-2/3